MLGCGSAFNHKLGNTAGLLRVELQDGTEKHILLDCGYDVPNKINIATLDAVLLTHTHADHAGGLEELAFRLKYQYPGKRVKLISRASVIDYAESMLYPVLRATMYSDNAVDEDHLKNPLSHYFDVERILPGCDAAHVTDVCKGLKIAMPKAPHIHTLPCASISMELSIGSRKPMKVWWSGDTCKVHSALRDHDYKLVFHEVQFGRNTTGKDAHTLHEDLVELRRDTMDNISRMVLMHLPESMPLATDAELLISGMEWAEPGKVYTII